MSSRRAAGCLILSGLLVTGLGEGSGKIEECNDTRTLILIDGTNNVQPEERNRMISMAKQLTAVQNDGNDVRYSLVADENINITKLEDAPNESSSHGKKISASAMDTAISEAFPFTLYPTRAEIVYFLTTDRTTIDVSPMILKKKLFLVVFGTGTSAEPSANDIATIGNHVYHIQHDEDVRNTVEKVRLQTCKDSHYLCDVDQHKDDSRYTTCTSCLDICSEKRIRASKCPQCPYMRLLPLVQEIKHGPTSDVNEPGTYIRDNKNVIISVLFSLAIVTGIMLSIFACSRKRVARFARATEDRRSSLPEGIGILEEGHENIQQGAVNHHVPLLLQDTSLGNHPDAGGDGRLLHQGQNYHNIRHADGICGIQGTNV